MSKDYVPAGDAPLLLWADRFFMAFWAEYYVWDFPDSDLDNLGEKLENYRGALEAHTAAQSILAGRTSAKKQARSALEGRIRGLARQIQTNPAVTLAQKARLGLPVGSGGAGGSGLFGGSVGLVVSARPGGRAELRFGTQPGDGRRNRLPAGALGVRIEARPLGGAWRFVAFVGGRGFEFVTPEGGEWEFRACAVGREGEGPWSAVCGTFLDGPVSEAVELRLAA